jgi:hypothetical protein
MELDEALERLRLHRMRDELFLANIEQDQLNDKTIQDRVEHMKLCYDMIESILLRHHNGSVPRQ